ncbi:GNAT family N-acetyltransferase [Plastoroseomonas arctica]|uniref:GNAT family N-acetyltransferase n=1 Tax=Plastoroseomonas arctica TaxID=1509237 RepID=A0AAF1JXH9_9PROT|nr:GNAT family N-acetyltransferase [Plastoroseomonas arctica]MBR0656191.1 GNAT family N-acetyltransferase [Plastoroseomonas arctica]
MPEVPIPAPLQLTLETAPAPELRARLGQAIGEFHSRTVPTDTRRFALLLHDADGALAAGLSGALSWQWLFVEAHWVADAWRGQGLGRSLLARAEAQARAEGCHSAWLDTFQARDFYIAQGWQPFGVLEDYPPGQARHFLRKSLVASPKADASA